MKFSTYQACQLVLNARKKLGPNSGELKTIFINEDLTRTQGGILYKARQLKSDKIIEQCWTTDGKILVKILQGRIQHVTSAESLDKLKSSVHSDDIHQSPVVVPKPLSVESSRSTKIFSDGTVCFASEEAPLSNWYLTQMKIDNISYNCVEQFYFATMAKAAKNDDIHKKIMTSSDPSFMTKQESKLKKTQHNRL